MTDAASSPSSIDPASLAPASPEVSRSAKSPSPTCWSQPASPPRRRRRPLRAAPRPRGQPPRPGGSGPGYSRAHGLSLTPFRGIISDYFMVCDSYFRCRCAAARARRSRL
jgi:hypothetical protein